jgi:hypothetical protein
MAHLPDGSVGIIGEIAGRVGVPALIAVLIITQLGPKIDRNAMIADRVDAQLQMVAVMCGSRLPDRGP